MTTTSDWPYDTDRNDPLTALRIPVVSNPWPRHGYLVAFDLDQIDEATERPDDREAAQLQSFLQQRIMSWYNPHWQTLLAKKPYDIDGGAAAIIFRKWGSGDWGYRRSTWQFGHTFFPPHPRVRAHEPDLPGSLSLVQVMDRIHSHGEDRPSLVWATWKADHPEAFGCPA
jgi:hypothetical protein